MIMGHEMFIVLKRETYPDKANCITKVGEFETEKEAWDFAETLNAHAFINEYHFVPDNPSFWIIHD